MIKTSERAVIEDYLAAMQSGAAGLEHLLELFADDATYVEAFSGQPQVHMGKQEIRAFFAAALSQHLNGERLRSEWRCTLPMLSGPMRGFDLVTLQDGLIARLETTVTEFPPMRNA